MDVRRRGWTAVLAAVLVAATAAGAGAQHRPGNALNWAFGGTVHTVARADGVAIVGGRFNAVAGAAQRDRRIRRGMAHTRVNAHCVRCACTAT